MADIVSADAARRVVGAFVRNNNGTQMHRKRAKELQNAVSFGARSFREAPVFQRRRISSRCKSPRIL
jgi:hypothetical protein